MHDQVQAAKAGDAEAFDELVRATYAKTYSLAYQLTGNDADAKDVAQETYLRAFKSLARFRGEAAFPTWLYRITVNSASNVLAKRRRHDHTVSLDEPHRILHLVETNPEHDPVDRALAAELRDRVRNSLASLPSFLRQVVELREIEGLPHAAIAERLGITETAAKVRLHRARQKLRLLLSDSEAEMSHASTFQPLVVAEAETQVVVQVEPQGESGTAA
jgi:RNA polymerase sigma-70 factor, ECF subfamily